MGPHLSTGEAARLLRVSLHSVNRAVDKGLFPGSWRLPGTNIRRLSLKAVLAWARANNIPVPDDADQPTEPQPPKEEPTVNEQRTAGLIAAARGGAQKGPGLFQGVGRNLLKAAEGLDEEQGVRLDGMLRRAERLAREAKELADDIATLAPALTVPSTGTAA